MRLMFVKPLTGFLTKQTEGLRQRIYKIFRKQYHFDALLRKI